MKNFKLLSISLAIACLGLIATPKPAHAFVLFGVHFFEKAKPSPTPTPAATPTPTPTATPTPTVVATPAGTHIGNNNLPTTGPEESVGALLLAVVAGFVARKYWQVSHQV
jgi:hypothetical protein